MQLDPNINTNGLMDWSDQSTRFGISDRCLEQHLGHPAAPTGGNCGLETPATQCRNSSVARRIGFSAGQLIL